MKVSKRVWDFDFPHVLKYAAMLSLSFVLAYLTYRYIELPVRRVKQKDQRRRGALWMFGGVVITGIFGILIIVMDGFPARFSSAILAFDHNYGTDESTAWRDGSCFLRPDQSATSFSPSCLDSTDQRVAQTLVFVWGDSHAADLFPGFRALQPQSKVRLAQYTASMCAPILGLQVRERPACHSINDAVMERIRVLRPNIVVLAAYWDVPDLDHDQTTRAEKLLHTIELVKAAGVERVVVIGSVPFWSNDVPMLLINELRHAPGGPTPHRLARTLLTTHDDSLLMATARKAGAFYVSIFDKLCDPTSCLATTGPGWRDVLTFDTSHFTEHGSMISSQLIWGSIIDAAK